jgi:oxygen-independent coproporphyrinogen-3 oxidase
MYGLPRQSLDGALSDLHAALALGPAHISHYQLTLEPGTAFFHRPPTLPDDDRTFEMQFECQRLLAAEGFEQYEISAYARPGRQCRHNLNYWRFGDYLGIGAGAHGKATVNGQVIRTEKPRSPREYLLGAGKAGARRRTVPAADLPFEFMLNALRLTEGIAPTAFERATDLDVSVIQSTLSALEGRGLLGRTDGYLRPTELGFRFLNDMQAAFLPARVTSLR